MTENTTYRDVMDEILSRITQGPWGPGTLLPGEVELAAEFGCSRTTMNRALSEVAALGYIDRRRKVGTRVRMSPLRAARFEMPLVRAEIETSGKTYGYRLIQREAVTAPAWLGARMHLAKGSPVIHVTCLHLADDHPFQLEDRWINAKALPEALDQGFASTGPNEWLVATVPFSEVEVSFSAMAAGALAVTHLGHSPGAPVFAIERATWWQTAAITFVTLCHHTGYRMTTRY